MVVIAAAAALSAVAAGITVATLSASAPRTAGATGATKESAAAALASWRSIGTRRTGRTSAAVPTFSAVAADVYTGSADCCAAVAAVPARRTGASRPTVAACSTCPADAIVIEPDRHDRKSTVAAVATLSACPAGTTRTAIAPIGCRDDQVCDARRSALSAISTSGAGAATATGLAVAAHSALLELRIRRAGFAFRGGLAVWRRVFAVRTRNAIATHAAIAAVAEQQAAPASVAAGLAGCAVSGIAAVAPQQPAVATVLTGAAIETVAESEGRRARSAPKTLPPPSSKLVRPWRITPMTLACLRRPARPSLAAAWARTQMSSGLQCAVMRCCRRAASLRRRPRARWVRRPEPADRGRPGPFCWRCWLRR